VFRKIYNYYFSPQKVFVKSLSDMLGFIPRFLPFYEQAFTHRGQEENLPAGEKYPLNNERLEFLGDAILDAATAEFLFKKYPTQDEGFLTQMRSKIVNRKTLNGIAQKMNLDVFLRARSRQPNNISLMMLGNTLEALVGAVYLDSNYAKTKQFVYKLLKQYVDIHELENLNDNYKSLLLEYCQKHHKKLHYELLNQTRADGKREKFEIGVKIDDVLIAYSHAFSKKTAEQQAAHLALEKLNLLGEE